MSTNLSKRKENSNKMSDFLVRILLNTASHPFDYAKVLIQIGYEPVAPRPGHTMLGKPAMKLPNIFQYVKHIKSVDGLVGCYAGLAPKVTGNLLSAIVTQRLVDYFERVRPADENEEDNESEEESAASRKKRFIRAVKCDFITHTTAIVVSQPFHVITIRMMAQFVGKETKYVGLFGSIREIYRQNGLLGFFSGLVPRVIGDIAALVLASCLTYAINYYILDEKELQVYTSASMSFLSSALTYPFQVVSNCMAVTNSGLMAGSPHYMPHYRNWVDCWNDLSDRNELKRGSSLLMRYYTGQRVVYGNQSFPVKSTKLVS